jgi:hypothetical protein
MEGRSGGEMRWNCATKHGRRWWKRKQGCASKTLAKRRQKTVGRRVLQSRKAHRDRACQDTDKVRVVDRGFMRQQGPALGENEVGSGRR